MKTLPKKVLLSFLLSVQVSLFAQVKLNNAMEAAEFAIANSILYSLQRQSVLLSMKSAKTNYTEFLPTLNFSWTDDNTINRYSTDSRSKSVTFGVNQIIFDGGKRKLNYDMNYTNAYYSKLSYEQSELAFKAQVIQLYYQCILQQKLVEIKTELEANAKSQIEVLKTEYEVGRALENDYLEYLISYKQIQNETVQCKRALKTYLRQFNVALNLDPDTVIEFGEATELDEELPSSLEPIFEKLWTRFQSTSLDIQKQNISLEYSHRQIQYQNRIYLPEIFLNASVSLSGNEYPLTEPAYTLKCNISFPNAKILPINYSNGYTFKNNELNGVKNNASTTLTPQMTYFDEKKAGSLQILQAAESNEQNLQSMYESFFEQISSFDDYSESISLLKQTIEIQKRRLEISEKQVNIGKMTRVDFLEEMTKLASKQVELLSSQLSLISSSHNLEIMLDIPFGGLYDACKDLY